MPYGYDQIDPSSAQDYARLVFEQILRSHQQAPKPEPWRDSLDAFARHMNPDYEPSVITKLLCQELERVEQGATQNLIFTMPPREGKTHHVSRLFPAWWLGKHPKDQIILTSYNDDKAEENSRHVRDILDDESYPFATKVRADTRAISHWETRDGGILHASGVGGGLTGYGGNVCVLDDPIKDHKEAASEPIRNNIWNWFTSVLTTRRMRGARIVIVATRWHEDDLIGRILKSKSAHRWRLVEVPVFAYDEVGDPLARASGEFLNGRIALDQIEDQRALMTDAEFQALYMCRPTSQSGNLFKREHWGSYDLDRLTREGLTAKLITVDSAFKEGTSSDFSAACVWGKLGNYVYLMDAWMERVDYPVLINRLCSLYGIYHAPIVIEDRGSGQSAVQTLTRQGVPAIADRIERQANHLVRADDATFWVESGHVLIPTEASWPQGTVSREAFLEQHASFPKGAHDDLVDCTSIAMKKFYARNPNYQRSSEGTRYTTYVLGSRGNRTAVTPGIGRDLFGAN